MDDGNRDPHTPYNAPPPFNGVYNGDPGERVAGSRISESIYDGLDSNILYFKMFGGKTLPLSLKRKSFDEGHMKSSGGQLSNTIGKNLGFWPTVFLGFQTLGAIYGMSYLELI